MSDEQPHEVGSRRRRREIREARERTARTEREQAARTGAQQGDQPLFDQEALSEDDVVLGPRRRGGRAPADERYAAPLATYQRPSSPESSPDSAISPASVTGRPFDQVVSPASGAAATSSAEANLSMAHPAPSGRAFFDQAVGSEGEEVSENTTDPNSGSEAELTADHEEDWPADHSSYDAILDDDEFAPDTADAILGDKERIELDEDGTPLLISSSSYGRGYQTVTPVETGLSRAILKHRREKRRRRHRILAFSLAGFAGLMVAFLIAFRFIFGGLLDGPEDYDEPSGDLVTFTVEEGDGWEVVANRLADQGIIASSGAFDEAMREAAELGLLHAGEYEMRQEMPAEEALDALSPEREAQHYVAVNAGQRIDAVYDALAESTGIEASEFREAAQDPTDFGLPEEASSLEGYVAPGEYRFPLEVEPDEALETMIEPTFERLEEAGITEEDEQWRTMIIASLITAEANHNQPDDYELIASAIENRLDPDNPETDGLLQIDAAVHYGAGSEGDLQAASEERQDESNSYNTYIHTGLPPGPIGAPASGTIEAAFDHPDTDYYYWVTVNIETGETAFNETYEDHQADVEVFQQWCEDNPGVCSPEEAESVENVEE